LGLFYLISFLPCSAFIFQSFPSLREFEVMLFISIDQRLFSIYHSLFLGLLQKYRIEDIFKQVSQEGTATLLLFCIPT